MEHHNHNHNHNHSFPLPSPNSTSSSSSSPSSLPSPTTLTRPDPSSPYPTTFVQADTTSFKQVVQLLTGSKPNPNPNPNPKQQTQTQTQTPPINPTKTRPATKLYERRTTSRISPLLPTPAGHPHPHPHSHSPRNVKQSPLSPTMLNFPGLMLSPVTPLIHDPFNRSSSCSPNINVLAEEKAIAQKCFFLHPVSPVSDSEPRLLPLFPLSSPKVSSSSTSD